MGMAFMVAMNPKTSFEEIIAHTRKIRPVAAPNILMIHYADRILSCKGEFLRAVETDPDITAARVEANAKRKAWAESNPGWEKAGPALR